MTTIIKNQKEIINNLKSSNTIIRKEAMRQAKSICITQWEPKLFTTFSDTLDKIRGHQLFPNDVLNTLPPLDVDVPL
jgi:hypothetical protein